MLSRTPAGPRRTPFAAVVLGLGLAAGAGAQDLAFWPPGLKLFNAENKLIPQTNPGMLLQWLNTDPFKKAGVSTAALYVSRDTTLDTNDILLTTYRMGEVGPLKKFHVQLNPYVSVYIPGGRISLFAQLDYLDQVSETLENNNLIRIDVLGWKPDVEAVTVFPKENPEFWQGREMTIVVTVRNVGLTDAYTAWAQLYLSADREITRSDTLIARVPAYDKRPLKPDEQQTTYPKVTIPATNHLPERSYLGVILDEAWDTPDNNVAVYSQQVTTGDFLPKINAKSLSFCCPKWGDQVTLTMELANKGRRNMPDSKMQLWLQPAQATLDPDQDWLMHEETVPGYSGTFVRYRHSFALKDLCGGTTYNIKAVWQVPGHEARLADIPFTLEWPTKPGYYIGQRSPYISSTKTTPKFSLCTKKIGTYSSQTFYLFLMGCSGTTPGLTVPHIGTLHLNWDACSEIGQGLHGTVFQNLLGTLSFGTIGSHGQVQPGPLWKPLAGHTVSFAAVYVDLDTRPPTLGFSEARSLPIKVK